MKKQILAIPRRAAPVACFVILLLAQNQDLSAQRAKRKDKTRIYTIDLSQSRVTATLTQEGFIARRYPTHRVEVKNFTGKIEVPERDETRIAVEVEAETKSLTNADEGMTEFERREFHNVLNNSVLESDKFPIIKFVSVSVSDARKSGETRSFTLNGDLTHARRDEAGIISRHCHDLERPAPRDRRRRIEADRFRNKALFRQTWNDQDRRRGEDKLCNRGEVAIAVRRK